MRRKAGRSRGVRVALAAFLAMGIWGCAGENGGQGSREGMTGQEAVQPEQRGSDGAASVESDRSDIRGKGFETPEEAVLTYLAGLKDGDFWSVESTFWEGDGGENISRQYGALCGLNLIPEIGESGLVVFEDSGEAGEFLETIERQMEKTDLGSLEFLGFVSPESLVGEDGFLAYQKALEASGQSDGGEMESRVAAVRVSRHTYVLFFDTVKREKRWYVSQLGGVLARIAGLRRTELAGVVRLDRDEEDLLRELLEDPPEGLEAWQEISGKISGSAAEERMREGKQIRRESEGFENPRQAAAAYLMGLKAGDLDRMIGTFSVESYGEHYDLLAYMEFMEMYIFMDQDVSFPGVNVFARDAICYDRTRHLEEDVLKQGRALFLCAQYLQGAGSVQGSEIAGLEDLEENVDLGSIEILGEVPVEAILGDEGMKKARGLSAQKVPIYGADEIEACVIAFECEGERYALFMEAVRYGDKWFNKDTENGIAVALGISPEFMGTAPLEALGNPKELESVMIPISQGVDQ